MELRVLDQPPLGCALTPAELAEQRGRAAALRASVANVRAERRSLEVRFADGVDEALVTELVETERACCSFFAIDYAERVLRIAVDAPEHEATLAELARAFSAA